ncbi:MAG: CHASE2 domain-containing protein [Planctomycetota bacterium]
MTWLGIKSRAWGIAVGVAVTLATALLYWGGALDGLVLAAADWQFKHVNRIDASGDIVMIDINDFALERVHRWPWPRSLHAELVDLLHELGAAAVLLDVVLSEPMAPRLEHPALTPDHDVDPAATVLGEITLEDAIEDDALLAEAMRQAGNVYPAMFFRLSKPGVSVPQLLTAAADLVGKRPAVFPHELADRLGSPAGVDVEALYHRGLILSVLQDDFTLELEQVASRISISPELIDSYLAEMKRFVARRLVANYLQAHPDAAFAEVRARFLPGLRDDQDSPAKQELLRAYRACRALEIILSRAPAVPAALVGRIPQGWDVTPPLDKLAAAARCPGLVTFEKDQTGGVLRRVPILINVEGKLVKQLGFAVVCDRLDIDDHSFTMDHAGYLTMSDRRGVRTWRLRLDENGLAVLNWHIDRAQPQWEHSFRHVAVTRVMEVALNRESIRRNGTLLDLRMARAVEARFAEQPAAHAEYALLVRTRNAFRRGRPAPPQAPTVDAQELETRLAGIEQATLDWLAFTVKSMAGLEPESPEEAAEFALHRSLADDLVGGHLRADIERKNADLARRNEYIINQLRPLIADKLCLVGYTAAAVADMVNAPVFENMPGVMAHANVANTFIQNRFPEVAPRWLNLVLLVLAGLVVTLITSSRGPWVSLISVGLVMALLLGGGVALFYRSVYIVASVVTVVAVFVAWAFITLYRQLTEERHKRNLARALGRSTSPAIAAEIIRRPGRLDLSPKPVEVSCYFSDLQGFTTLSERLGPADTQAILNRYLERMSGVLVPYRAFSKFMGDGIFAFFNAPLLPVERHAAVACEVALRCVEALGRLKSEQADGPHAEVFGTLVMRGGIHTGTAYVGEFGSENQIDYTCIGDTVNLAARLEPANKVFGTRVIVSQACRDGVGEGFEFRPLGKVQVKGKARAVSVHELLGRSAEVDEQRLAHARWFAGAVALFQERRFVEAQQTFTSSVQDATHDPAVELYLTEIARCLQTPPDADWNQAIQLTTK